MAVSEVLSNIYYNVSNPAGFSGILPLYKAAKKQDSKITLRDVKNWWSSQRIPTKFRLARKKFPRTKFIISGANQVWGADLIDMSRPALKRANHNFVWLLVITDLFSRKVIALVPQKTKSSKETAHSLDSIFSEAKNKPYSFMTDQGGEFLGSESQKIYKKYNINYFTSKDITQKVAPTERLNREIKARLWKFFASSQSYNWIDQLAEICSAINSAYNRSIRMSPNQAELKRNEAKVFNTLHVKTQVSNFSKLAQRKSKVYRFEIGQIVRIQTDQAHWKGYEGTYSDALYKIARRKMKSFLPVYYLEELLTNEPVEGIFYESEMEPVMMSGTTLPRIAAIHGFRRDDMNREQALVSFHDSPKKKTWIFYNDLIPAKN
ncbi:MAG: transposase family protein [Candidatus Omnitrophica bacterium]|nr:transposase family protein [Candidatus Omnitrophota bacterium]